MPEQTTLDPKWMLIQDRLGVKDLAAWLRQFRGDKATNPEWKSWDAIARTIYDRTTVEVTAQGLRYRWSKEVDPQDSDAAVPAAPAAAASDQPAPGGAT